MRDGNKDKGHWARKAIWLSVGILLFIPHGIFQAATWLDDWIMHIGERLYVWAHPCLFTKRPPRRRRHDG